MNISINFLFFLEGLPCLWTHTKTQLSFLISSFYLVSFLFISIINTTQNKALLFFIPFLIMLILTLLSLFSHVSVVAFRRTEKHGLAF